eukprot:2036540-Pyramimonas_sp.AAC.1
MWLSPWRRVPSSQQNVAATRMGWRAIPSRHETLSLAQRKSALNYCSICRDGRRFPFRMGFSLEASCNSCTDTTRLLLKSIE